MSLGAASDVLETSVEGTRKGQHFFYDLKWVNPRDGSPLTPRIVFEDPRGRPLYGALVTADGRAGYPIVDGVVLATPEFAHQEADWLRSLGLEPVDLGTPTDFQSGESVESFGFQWMWDSEARTEEDLRWRVASRYRLERGFYKDKVILDAGSGAGDQSRWLLEAGAKAVVSVDLSAAIFVVKKKLGMHPNWVGIRGDLTRLPLADGTFDFTYCEGVIQHTRDSRIAVEELCRVLRPSGQISATHYGYQLPATRSPKQLLRRIITRVLFHKRWEKLSKWNRDELFLYTGVLAWLAHRPLIGPVLRRLGLAVYNPRMLTFKSTWSCTYDSVGTHQFQRELSQSEFLSCFEKVRSGSMQLLFADGNVVLFRKAVS